MSEERFLKDDSLKSLFSYIFGLEEYELTLLLEQYSQKEGPQTPDGLYSYLSMHGKSYAVLWCLFKVTDEMSLVAAAVIGPGRDVVWHGVGLSFLQQDSTTLKAWPRILEMSAGEFAEAPPGVSESDYWSVSHLARQCKDSWQGAIPHLFFEAEAFFGGRLKNSPNPLTDSEFTAKTERWFHDWFKEMLGKTLPLQGFWIAPVNLPELREVSLRLYPLRQALEALTPSLEGLTPPGEMEVLTEHLEAFQRPSQSSAEEVLLPTGEVALEELVVDPVEGIPMGDLRPGDMVALKDPYSGEDVPGEVYVARKLGNREYEVHGKNRETGGFFRYHSSGDVKIRLYSSPGQQSSPWWEENKKLLLLFMGALLLFVTLVLSGT